MEELKLPEVGKRYKLCVGMNQFNKPEYVTCEVLRLENTFVEVLMGDSGIKHFYEKDTFMKGWEEIKENKIVGKVERIKKELQEDIKSWMDEIFGDFVPLEKIKPLEPKPVYETFLKTKALIDAMNNKILYENLEDNEYFKAGWEAAIHYSKNKKDLEPKSIWKDVSELPETTSHIIAKDCLGRYSVFESNNKMILNLKDGGIVNQDIIFKFCLLSDYINDQEQFKQDVLERLNKRRNSSDEA
jgi:hypothetical protein